MRRSAAVVFACTAFAALIAMAAILVVPAAPAASASETCPNEARREEQGAAARALPDCRAYELVSLPYQPSPFYLRYYQGYPPSASTGFKGFDEEPVNLPEAEASHLTALDGNAAIFGAIQPNSESDSIYNNLSRRGPSGWIGENLIPPRTSPDPAITT